MITVLDSRGNGLEGQEALPRQWSDKRGLSLGQECNLSKCLGHVSANKDKGTKRGSSFRLSRSVAMAL